MTTRAKLVLVLFSVVAAAANAQDTLKLQTELQNRLVLFQNTQTLCKARVIADPKLAANFVVATKMSLSEACECAALLTVSSMSAEQVDAIAAGQADVAGKVSNDLYANLGNCVKIK